VNRTSTAGEDVYGYAVLVRFKIIVLVSRLAPPRPWEICAKGFAVAITLFRQVVEAIEPHVVSCEALACRSISGSWRQLVVAREPKGKRYFPTSLSDVL